MGERGIDRVVTTPAPSPGFIGEGHTAVPVLDPREFERNDPFIVLMDDRMIGESRADIIRLSELFMAGKMPRISQLARDPNKSSSHNELAEAVNADRN